MEKYEDLPYASMIVANPSVIRLLGNILEDFAVVNHTCGDNSVFMCLSCILESYIGYTSIKYTNLLQITAFSAAFCLR